MVTYLGTLGTRDPTGGVKKCETHDLKTINAYSIALASVAIQPILKLIVFVRTALCSNASFQDFLWLPVVKHAETNEVFGNFAGPPMSTRINATAVLTLELWPKLIFLRVSSATIGNLSAECRNEDLVGGFEAIWKILVKLEIVPK